MNETIKLSTVWGLHVKDELLVGTMSSPTLLVRKGTLERRDGS